MATRSPVRQADLFREAQPGHPVGLRYEPDFITPAEEQELLAGIRTLPLHEAQYKQYTAKRRIASFGAKYDFSSNVLESAPGLVPFLQGLRTKVADWLELEPDRFAQALVAEYRPGTALGWHRDVPQFGVIVGVSLAGACRMRFRPYPVRQNKREGVFALELEPRSAYVLHGDARWGWQHSIPVTQTLRYSITFRTMRGSDQSKPDSVNAEIAEEE
jgi:alkylated DNA repair dioxygenase AlkB